MKEYPQPFQFQLDRLRVVSSFGGRLQSWRKTRPTLVVKESLGLSSMLQQSACSRTYPRLQGVEGGYAFSETSLSKILNVDNRLNVQPFSLKTFSCFLQLQGVEKTQKMQHFNCNRGGSFPTFRRVRNRKHLLFEILKFLPIMYCVIGVSYEWPAGRIIFSDCLKHHF